MRKLFLILLLTLLAGVGLVALVERDPGYVLVSYGLTTIETSVWVAGLLLTVFYALLYLLFRSLARVLATRGALSGWLSGRAHSRELVKLEMSLAEGDYSVVVGALGEAGPGQLHDRELALLAQARRGLGDWPELRKLLPWLKRRRALAGQDLDALEVDVWMGELNSGTDIRKAWTGLPAEARKQGALLELYARLLIESGEDLEVEKLLTKSIKRDWDGRLVAQYGRIRGRDPARRLKIAEGWLKNHPQDPDLMLCLGRLALRNKLWGQARDYFESSHRLRPSAEACAELARLLFSLGERELSAQYYREGLLLRESNLPDLPLPAKPPQRGAAFS